MNLYTAEQTRAIDRYAIEQLGIPGIVLMKRAGRTLLNALLTQWPQPQKITIYCGAGNNGGDGYIVAGLAAEQGIDVEVITLVGADKIVGDAGLARQFAEQHGVVINAFREQMPTCGVIVDALLGTGYDGKLRPNFAAAIEQINASGLPVIAADIPSGVEADTGEVSSVAVKAQFTASFMAAKQGLFTGAGMVHAGIVGMDDLGVPLEVREQFNANACLLNWEELAAKLPTRSLDAHKGHSGHVLVVGGEVGFGGAPLLSADAALHAGAGLVSLATRADHVSASLARRPEVMVRAVNSNDDFTPLLAQATVIVVGPGLGQGEWGSALLRVAIASGKPLVLDADALNLLAQQPDLLDLAGPERVLTPHPGEAARLLGITVAEVENDRITAARQLAQQFHSIVLLKGPGTVLAAPEQQRVVICPYGNPGMAVGGMGDVLAGVLGGLMAQKLPLRQAVTTGVVVHSLAADYLHQKQGMRGMLASELIPEIRYLLNSSVNR